LGAGWVFGRLAILTRSHRSPLWRSPKPWWRVYLLRDPATLVKSGLTRDRDRDRLTTPHPPRTNRSQSPSSTVPPSLPTYRRDTASPSDETACSRASSRRASRGALKVPPSRAVLFQTFIGAMAIGVGMATAVTFALPPESTPPAKRAALPGDIPVEPAGARVVDARACRGILSILDCPNPREAAAVGTRSVRVHPSLRGAFRLAMADHREVASSSC
jgi:hypothetical protein